MDAIAALITPIDDIGTVVKREAFYTQDGVWSLLKQDDGTVKGVLILWKQIVSQTDNAGICQIVQHHRFGIEVFTPYENQRVDGKTSHQVHVERVEAVNDALNATTPNVGNPWNLGLTEGNVRHFFLQGSGDSGVGTFGTQETNTMAHSSPYTLDVICTVSTS